MHSSREHFHTYLQSLDVERGGLPDAVPRPAGAGCSRHYGVDDLERTPELEEAVFRIFLAQQRSTPDVALVIGAAAALDRRAAAGRRRWPAGARALLERLVRATQLRFPVVGDLARSVRFRWFDQPLVRRGARRGAGRVSATRSPRWPPTPTRPTAPSGSRRWPRSPSRSSGFLAERLEQRRARPRSRCWRCWSAGTTASTTCTTCARVDVDGRPFVVADYSLDDRPTTLVSTLGTVAELADPAGRRWSGASTAQVADAAHRRRGRRRPLPRLARRARAADEAERPAARRWSAALPFASDVRRVAVAVCAGGEPPVGYFTFRPGRRRASVAEDDLIRGVHPMVGRRLNLWRLRNFDVTRLRGARGRAALRLRRPGATRPTGGWWRWPRCASSPSSATTTARSPRLPHAERAVENCLEAIRRARVARGAAGDQARHEPRLGARLAGRRRSTSTS